jgi:hypothetical protein
MSRKDTRSGIIAIALVFGNSVTVIVDIFQIGRGRAAGIVSEVQVVAIVIQPAG